MTVNFKRIATLLTSAVASGLACYLFVRYIAFDSNDWLDFPRTLLISLSTFWLSYGVVYSSLGLFARRPQVPRLPDHEKLTARIAILVPVYNEDPVSTFSRIAAMDVSLAATGQAETFDFAVLSDTRSPEVAAEEAVWFEHLLAERQAHGRMFYRRRESNVGKKAGNIEEFFRRSGGAYDFALILDADSLLEGDTIVEMARRMQADPSLGLLQSLPTIINARSFFGRVMQFSARYFSPVFSRGISELQGKQGPFWGHNAMVRVQAFAASCGLPELAGKPPFGGHILSHDYVEAALLARAGWTVRLDPDLLGSFEEGPENLIEYAKRDRRWCQGNLQHSRLVAAPGLHWWSRFIFIQGIMAYVASPIWMAFLLTSIAASALTPQFVYYYGAIMRPYRPEGTDQAGLMLLATILILLILPKILILIRGFLLRQNRPFGGTMRVAATIFVEILYSSVMAPIMLMLQSRSVLQVMFGLDGGWPATVRSEGRLTLRESWLASWWIVAIGSAAMALSIAFAPAVAPWVAPVTVPMIIAPLVIALSSRSRRNPPPHLLFATPEEYTPSPVMVERARILAVWTQRQHSFQPTAATVLAGDSLTHVDI